MVERVEDGRSARDGGPEHGLRQCLPHGLVDHLTLDAPRHDDDLGLIRNVARATNAAILVLVSGAHRVDEVRLSGIVGGPIERAGGKFVRERTGYAIGGVPPIGHQEPLPTYLDEHLLAERLVWAAAGTPRTLFCISPEDLLRVTSAMVVAVACQ